MTQNGKESTQQDADAQNTLDALREQALAFIEGQEGAIDEAFTDAQKERMLSAITEVALEWTVAEALVYNRLIGRMLAHQLNHIQQETGELPPTVELVTTDDA